MDYVVAGFGIGAILALIGFALWELFGNSEEPGQNWLTRAAIGLMIGSLVIWAITGVTLLSTIDDSTGSHLVLLTTLVTLIAIAAGTFWYWRADQALLESLPPQQRSKSVVRQTALAATPQASTVTGDAELTEWDNWPERPGAQIAVAQPVADPVPEVAFEPEVAAEPAADAESDTGIDIESGKVQVTSSEATDESAPTSEPADVEGESVDSLDPTPLLDSTESEQLAPAATVADDIEEPDPTNIQDGDSDQEALAAQVQLPPMVRPIQTSETVDPMIEAAAGPAISPKVVRIPTPEPIVVAEDVVVAEAVVETADPDVSSNNGVAPAETPVAFESSLLADIDVTNVEGDVRYQSPLLADLEKNPDELEGVGLAKWRSDARLTAEETEEPPAPQSRRRG